MTDSANDMQVGGTHYRSEYQHWDLIEEFGVGYLEGCASKYVSRHRQKNGVQDLDKAEHYINKLIELMEEGKRGEMHQMPHDKSSARFPRGPRGWVPAVALTLFSIANELTPAETDCVASLCTWQDLSDLREALRALERVREEVRQAEADEELPGVQG